MHRYTLALLVCALAACGSDSSPAAPSASANTPSAAATPAANAAAGAPAPAVNTPPVAPAAPAQQPVAAMPPQAAPAPTTTPAVAPTPQAPAAGGMKLAMDECGLHTQYAGDEYCINAPPADKGFQVHWGPKSYESPEATYVLMPGQEDVVTMTETSGNSSEIMYYYRQYRMRPGSHHVIFTTNGRRLGGTQNLAKDNPDFGIIPPENENVGIPLPAHSPIAANMHFYNFGDKPILREVWVNFWYKDAATVKETAKEVFSMTGVRAAVAHSHVVLGATCPITGNGRALSLYGHRHMSNIRFSIWHTSGGKKDLVFEDYDPLHPAALDYNSLATNPVADPVAKVAGGSSGILNLKQGDTLDFECEIINMTNKNFVGANEANDDEMCIMVGDSVGAGVSAACTALPSRRVD